MNKKYFSFFALTWILLCGQDLRGEISLTIINNCGSSETVDCSPADTSCCQNGSPQCHHGAGPNFEFKSPSKQTLTRQTIDMSPYPENCVPLTCGINTFGDDSQCGISGANDTVTVTLNPSTNSWEAPHCVLTCTSSEK